LSPAFIDWKDTLRQVARPRHHREAAELVAENEAAGDGRG
jgi:hypothetical protein